MELTDTKVSPQEPGPQSLLPGEPSPQGGRAASAQAPSLAWEYPAKLMRVVQAEPESSFPKPSLFQSSQSSHFRSGLGMLCGPSSSLGPLFAV